MEGQLRIVVGVMKKLTSHDLFPKAHDVQLDAFGGEEVKQSQYQSA